MDSCWNFLKRYGRPRRQVTLAVLGLDNAGKTATIRTIQGENPDDVSPTVGFSAMDVKRGQFDVSMYDLGGGQHIRDIWKHYFSESHGIIFVVDSSDVQRMSEVKDTVAKVISHPCITGKPILLLANKQDKDGAQHEADIRDRLSLETLMNEKKCSYKIVECSTASAVGKRAIRRGLQWLVKGVAARYDDLGERVRRDAAEQREQEAEERRQRAERVRQARQERLAEMMEEERERKLAELVPVEEFTMANPILSSGEISELVLVTRRVGSRKDDAEQTDQAKQSQRRKMKMSFWKKNKVGPLTPDGPAETQHRSKAWFSLFECKVVKKPQ